MRWVCGGAGLNARNAEGDRKGRSHWSGKEADLQMCKRRGEGKQTITKKLVLDATLRGTGEDEERKFRP
jgi:hypothetical protein